MVQKASDVQNVGQCGLERRDHSFQRQENLARRLQKVQDKSVEKSGFGKLVSHHFCRSTPADVDTETVQSSKMQCTPALAWRGEAKLQT